MFYDHFIFCRFYTFVKEANTAAMNNKTHVEHPINAFHLVQRAVTKWSFLFDEEWWSSVLLSEHAKGTMVYLIKVLSIFDLSINQFFP